MTISELGALGEFVSSIGVLITLVYLAVQVKHSKKGLEDNTTAILGANEVTGNESSVRLGSALYQDPDLTRIIISAAESRKNLTDVGDIVRFDQYCHSAVQLHQVFFMQWKKGLLDDEYWGFCIRYQGSLFYSMKGVQEWWWRNRHIYTDSYRNLINSLIENEGWHDSDEYLERFR